MSETPHANGVAAEVCLSQAHVNNGCRQSGLHVRGGECGDVDGDDGIVVAMMASGGLRRHYSTRKEKAGQLCSIQKF